MAVLPTEIKLQTIKIYLDDLLEREITLTWKEQATIAKENLLSISALEGRMPLIVYPIIDVLIALPEFSQVVYKIMVRARDFHYEQYKSHTEILNNRYRDPWDWDVIEDRLDNEQLRIRSSVFDRVCMTLRARIEEEEEPEKMEKRRAKEFKKKELLKELKARELLKEELSRVLRFKELEKMMENEEWMKTVSAMEWEWEKEMRSQWQNRYPN